MASPDLVIDRWVSEQLAPWRDKAFDFARVIDAEQQRHDVFIFSFRDGKATFRPKSRPSPGYESHRAGLYASFLSEAYRRYCPDREFDVALFTGDEPRIEPDFPLIAFQKPIGSRVILLPDVDFLRYNFYTGDDWIDPVEPVMKSHSAVFVGATTGALTITAEKLRANGIPRIRSAKFFRDNPRVTFKLPTICQVESEEVRKMILEMDLGKQRIPWSEQFRHMFLLSMDGNGATCSRVVAAMKSNSVLVKYKSNSVLYYFSGMQDRKHFVSIERDDQVEDLLDEFELNPVVFHDIAQRSKEFYDTFLVKESVVEYMGRLLAGYSGMPGRR